MYMRSIIFLLLINLIVVSSLGYSYSEDCVKRNREPEVCTYTVNGRIFNSKQEAMDYIQNQNPNDVFEAYEEHKEIIINTPDDNNDINDFDEKENEKPPRPYIQNDNYVRSDKRIDFEQLKEHFIKETNEYRRKHGVPPLVYDKTIEQKAQRHANLLAKLRRLKHERDDIYGENLGTVYGSSGDDIVQKWYDEIKYYNFDNPRYTSQVGHFTQVVWKSSKKFGFGIAKDSRGQIYVVCKYFPPGNVLNQMAENVPRLKYKLYFI
uniref:SCP domain-containing protein n=1 Tax=Parastrongyloides trichosuri TaxID=131310 RepID=A0A0N5A2Y1_PARTI